MHINLLLVYWTKLLTFLILQSENRTWAKIAMIILVFKHLALIVCFYSLSWAIGQFDSFIFFFIKDCNVRKREAILNCDPK